MTSRNLNPNPVTIGYVVGGGLKENLHVRLTVPPRRCRKAALW